MQHVVAHKLRAKAMGMDDDAIVVVDPHSDLVRSLLELVPPKIADQVYLIDLADDERVAGINLLDTQLFPDRDRATDNTVQVVKNLWEHTLKSLYEANRNPRVQPDQQYTILDGLYLLSDDAFRKEVLSKATDPYLVRWWARGLPGLASPVPGRRRCPGADQARLLRLVQAGAGHPRAAQVDP